MKFLYYLFGLLIVGGCSEDFSDTVKSQMIVEGWIESGGFPVVRVTRSVPITSDYVSLDSLEKHVLKWARVTISDGEKEVVLTGRYSNRYFPPYIFTTYDMEGVEGKTYTLKVQYGDMYAHSVTSIPKRVLLDSIAMIPAESKEEGYYIKAYIADSLAQKDYYLFMVRTDMRKYEYYPAYLGLFDDTMITNKGIFVYRGRNNLDRAYTTYFLPDEDIDLKLLHVDVQTFNFWRSFNVMTDFSKIPGLPSQLNLRGNVEGALGYWFGYGMSRYRLKIPVK